MQITQIYVFSGNGFVKKANEFIRENQEYLSFDRDMSIDATGTYISIVALVRLGMCDEIERRYAEKLK